ncbi:DUF5071 domain-containing protein [Paenibacillus thermotolerans]|uniref:DUF5071 domain-containing protein n=1 Tax=Paenibacillus thermotolerans TaxID=3027807 RepID=UPI002367F1E0|nr:MULTISPECIES: DUF5071 domain-containing protein [unclassified Paenibacillus]
MNENLPPQRKLDAETLAHLKRLSEEERIPLLPELLRYLRAGDDPSPTASELAELLISHGYELVPLLKAILESGEGAGKYAVMELLVKKLPEEITLELAPELLRLAMNPSDEDESWEVDELAEELLSRIL